MKTKRPLTLKDAVRYLTLLDADLTNEAIQQRPAPTTEKSHF